MDILSPASQQQEVPNANEISLFDELVCFAGYLRHRMKFPAEALANPVLGNAVRVASFLLCAASSMNYQNVLCLR